MTPKRGRTLAFRLTLWYAGIFTVSSWIAFLLFFSFVTNAIKDRIDQEIQWQASQFATVYQAGGLPSAESFALLETEAAGVKKVFFRILHPTGQAFATSKMSYWKDIGVSTAAVNAVLQGQSQIFETVTLRDRKDEIRVLYARIAPNLILQVGHSIEETTRYLEAFRTHFIATMAMLIALAVGVGWFMARRASGGIENVTRTAREISSGSLQVRVPVKGTGDEVDQLATTFNQMLDRIQVLIAEVREMSDNIAHDLKSPLTRLRGFAEVTLTTSKTVDEYEVMAAGVVEECDRLLGLINTMLMISRTESGVDPVAKEEVDIARVLQQACELFGPTAEDAGLKLTCRTPEHPTVPGDSHMLQRLLANLIDNAVKYTPSHGTVSVSLSVDVKGKVLISVNDTGIGISAADLPRVFDRFYRCDQSRSVAGAGLGLSLARAIARAHDGDITVKSSPKQGSTFTVTLPTISKPARPTAS